MKVYDGSLWVAAYASLSGAMFGANNLSDVADAAASRTNLGLGTGNTPTFAGINTTGNATFGDNDKAIFGAGSDLQIYHDPANGSIVKDSGDGRLLLDSENGTGISLTSGGIAKSMISATKDGDVKLYYDNASKLATTSTGIDVTGTVTADGLTVDGDTTFNLTSGETVKIFRADYATLSLGADNSNRWDIQEFGSNDLFFARVNSGTVRNTVKMEGSTGDISFYEDTGTTAKFFWDASAESLGIGTASPDLDLNIEGTGFFGMHLGQQSDNADFSGRLFFSSTSATSGIVGREGGLGFYTGTNIAGSSTGTERVRIDTSGNVGIGTTSPTRQLDVSKAGTAYIRASDTSSSVNMEMLAASSGGWVGTQSNHSLNFQTNNTERMRIDSSGNLLVGKTATNFNNVGSEFRADGQIIGTRDGGSVLHLNRKSSDGDIASFYKNGSTVGSIGTSGNDLSIGTGDLVLKFYDAGPSFIPRKANDANSDNYADLGNTNNRFKDAHFSGTVNAANFNTTSDATLKTNVETLTGSLDAVKSLRGVSFDWLENGNSEVGVIAQEVEAVLPDVVSTNDQGIKSVKYGNMVALLIEAMKEQQAQIDELKAKLGE